MTWKHVRYKGVLYWIADITNSVSNIRVSLIKSLFWNKWIFSSAFKTKKSRCVSLLLGNPTAQWEHTGDCNRLRQIDELKMLNIQVFVMCFKRKFLICVKTTITPAECLFYYLWLIQMFFCFLSSMWKGLNVNCTDSSGYTPLHHASLNGHR